MVDAKTVVPTNVELPKDSLLRKLSLVFLAVGVTCLVFFVTLYQQDHVRAMFGYLYGFAVVLSLGLGALAFVLLQHVTRARWSVVLRRVPEAVISTLPLFIIFFIPIALSIHDIFPWTHQEHMDAILQKKAGYLNENFFFMRSFGYLLIWAVVGVVFYRLSVMQDNGRRFELSKTMQALSAPAIILFGLTLTFAAFDWFMSLQPHWYSTIFGVYYFAGCMLFGLAFMTLMVLVLQKAGPLKNLITGEHLHDLGKLMFGFTVFWAYISFSQFMLIWYGNTPEEIEFYTHRLHHGWDMVSYAIPIIHFFIPFFLLMSRALKRVKLVLVCNACWVIVMHLIDLYWLIMPTYPDPTTEGGPTHFSIKLVDIMPLLGLFLILFACFLFVLSRRSVVAVGDPRLKESLAFENI